MEEKTRNPTEFNTDLLRAWMKDYFTRQAAAFEKTFKEGKYQAAVYIKDCADAVYNFGAANDIFTREDLDWLFGNAEKGLPAMFPREKEAVCRARVDSEMIQDEVSKRYENLITRLRSAVRLRLPYEVSRDVILLIDEILRDYLKAADHIKNPRK